MKSFILIAMAVVGLTFGNFTYAESGDDHSGYDHKEEEGKQKKKKKKAHKHEEHKGHKEGEKKHDDHGHDDEEKGHDHSKEDKHKHGEEEGGHADHDEHEVSKFGAGKAILEVNGEGKRFRLAKGAIKTMELKSVKLESPSNGVYEVPASSVVDFQDEIGVYKRNGDWFELVEIKVVQRGKYAAKIKTKELSAGDEIVNTGVALLRVAHLEASGQGGKGHVH